MISLLAMANIKKNRGNLISLVSLIFIAALFLNVGLLFFLNLGDFYMSRAEAQNAAHAQAVIPRGALENSDLDFFLDYNGVTAVETEDILNISNAEFLYGGAVMTRSFFVHNYDAPREMTNPPLIGGRLQNAEYGVYLPYTMQTGGYRVGDEFKLTYDEREHVFQVAGFLEVVYFGSTISGLFDMYLPNESYERFASDLNDPDLDAVAISSQMRNRAKASTLVSDYKVFYDERNPDSLFAAMTVDILEIYFYVTMIPNLIATVLIMFSAIIVLVCVVVVRFRIITNIQDGMTNIGALKAIGYTSAQIIASIVLQFTSIAAAASVAGIGASYLVVPALSQIFAGLLGLNWVQGFDTAISGASFGLILVSVVIVSVHSARKISGLHPIVALHGGETGRHARKNRFPLDLSALQLQLALALKTIAQNGKQTVMIAFILMGVSFTMLFSFVMHYNFAVDNTAFANLGTGEPCDIIASLDEFSPSLLDGVNRMPEVQEAFYADMNWNGNISVMGKEWVSAFVMADFSQSQNQLLMEGRWPAAADEFLMPAVLAKRYGKKIGDTVDLKVGKYSEVFTITGLSQTLNNAGKICALTLDGMRRLEKDYELTELNIYLNKYEDSHVFADTLKSELGGRLIETIDINDMLASNMNTYIVIAEALVVAILITTAMVVALVLYLIIKINISQRKRDLGIMKAVGYTTLQLMNQIALSFIPAVMLGAGLGGLLGGLYINHVLTFLFASMGIMKMAFIIKTSWAFITVAAVSGFSYLTALVISWRIKDISPYVLTSE